MPNEYSRKIENINAIQWDGKNEKAIATLTDAETKTYSVIRIEGVGHVREGSWIVKNADGTFSVKSDSEFTDSYE